MTEKPNLPDAEWLASVLDAMDDLVLVKGPRSRLIWANRAFRDCYGMSNEELRLLIDSQQSNPDDTLQYVRDDCRVFVERATIDIPAEPVTDHLGQMRFFHTKKSPIFDESGEVAVQVGVSRALGHDNSVESSHSLREQGHASTRNVRALVRSMPAPVIMLDAAHRIIMWNDAFAAVIDVAGTTERCSSRLLYADYEEALELRLPLSAEFDAILQGDKPTSRVLELVCADAQQHSFRVDCRTWTDASEIVSGTMAVFHDITEILANEHRLLEANEELAQFNYRVSHDIVAPISTARGCLGLAIEEIGGEDPAELTELLDDAQGQLDRLDRLVTDLSTLSRAGAETGRRDTVDLKKLVDTICSDHLDLSRERITIDTDFSLTTLQSDPPRIRQMLSNLIDNAVKYRDPAESKLSVCVRSHREGDAIVIEVSDNGVGIDPEFGEKAFEMFTRGGSSTPGTGLGLYIIRKHADRLGGTLSIARCAKPTVMRIELPDSIRLAA